MDDPTPIVAPSRPPRRFRRTRIAVSVLFGLLAMAISMLWVRSYAHYDWLGGINLRQRGDKFEVLNGCLFESANGAVVVLSAGSLLESLRLVAPHVGSSPASPSMRVIASEGESALNGFRARDDLRTGMFRGSLPHWFLAFIMGMVAAVPWMTWRFSLRTMLITMTLVAVVLGLAMWMIR